MSRIAVTGATGFIGRAVCIGANAAGHEVIAIGRNLEALSRLPAGVIKRPVADLVDEDALARQLQGVATVVHLADQADRVAAQQGTSQRLTMSVAAAARSAGADDILFASSIYASLDERGYPNSYGSGKRASERTLMNSDAPRSLILRLPPIYGHGSRGSLAILAKLVSKGIPLPLGRANALRDYLFIDNLVELILAIISSPAEIRARSAGQIFEPSDGHPISTAQLVRFIAEAMGRRARLVPVPRSLLGALGRIAGTQAQIRAAFDPLIAIGNSELSSSFGWQPRQQMPQSLGFLSRHQ